MSCTVSQGVVLCQLGYLGALFALWAATFTALALYAAGWVRGERSRRNQLLETLAVHAEQLQDEESDDA